MQNSEPAKLMSQLQTARFLGRSVRTLTLWRRRRYGPTFLKVGGAIMYTVADVTAFLNGCRVTVNAARSEASR